MTVGLFIASVALWAMALGALRRNRGAAVSYAVSGCLAAFWGLTRAGMLDVDAVSFQRIFWLTSPVLLTVVIFLGWKDWRNRGM